MGISVASQSQKIKAKFVPTFNRPVSWKRTESDVNTDIDLKVQETYLQVGKFLTSNDQPSQNVKLTTTTLPYELLQARMSSTTTGPPKDSDSTTSRPPTSTVYPSSSSPSPELLANANKDLPQEAPASSTTTAWTPPQNPKRSSSTDVKTEDLSALVPKVHVSSVDCAKLFSGDPDELNKADIYQKSHKPVFTPNEEFVNIASNCESFKEGRYITQPLTKEEEDFPLAYSILMFKDVAQTERLLRAIYRPQNFYCIHVDMKSTPVVREAIQKISECFPNVFMASKHIDVQWGM